MTTDREANEQTAKRDPTAGATAGSAGSADRANTRSSTGQAPDRGARAEHSTTDCTSAERLKEQAKDHLFECDRNARYHTTRRTFLDQCHRWMMVAVVVSGSAAVVAVTEGSNFGGAIILLLPTVFGAISVVFRLTDQARDHEILARKFYRIAATIRPEHATADQIHQWRNDIFAAYEDEPDMYHALNAECYNTAAQALGKKTRQRMYTHHYWLRNWRRFTAEDFPQIVPP